MTIKSSATSASINGIDSGDAFYFHFENSGSDNLAVNGSVTPVEFTLPLPAGTSFLLNSVSFVIGADSEIQLGSFGTIAGLTNGILYSANGESNTIFKDNGDVFLVASSARTESVKFGSVVSSIISGTWDFTDTYNGNAPRIINNNLVITIRDDLLLVPYFKVSCHGIIFE